MFFGLRPHRNLSYAFRIAHEIRYGLARRAALHGSGHDRLRNSRRGSGRRPPQRQGRAPRRQSIGEIIVRGDGVMEGYWRQPEASAEALRGGWFHTGDMATLNEDGYALLVV